MSLEFATHLANYTSDQLVSTRKELSSINNRYDNLYNDHENLKDAMIEMKKKLRELEQTVASKDEELRASKKEWSTDHILRDLEDEWSNGASDIAKIKKLDAKYEAARQIEELKSGFERDTVNL
jgi:chromosome segregation ATPase